MNRRSIAIFAAASLCACGGTHLPQIDLDSLTDEASLTAEGTLAPQSFVRGRLSDVRPRAAWGLSGAAGDVVALDAWPTPSTSSQNGLHPVLVLLGPARNGKRPVVATGGPRNADDRHQAIDGFTLPKAGTYLIVINQAGPSLGGEYTLRYWTSASHAPRPEAAQLDLTLRPSRRMNELVLSHHEEGSRANEPWTDAEVDSAVESLLDESDRIVAFSDARALVGALEVARSRKLATEALLRQAKQAALLLLGRPADFAALTALQQAFALYWLGDLTRAALAVRSVAAGERSPALRNVSAQIEGLVRSWPGAKEPGGQRRIHELSAAGTVYGYSVAWWCEQRERDGSPVFVWYSSDWFDKGGRWLGQLSQGATEPDDD